MIRFRHRGSFKSIEKFLRAMAHNEFRNYLEECGQKGVAALASVTPSDTGMTAASWTYGISDDGKSTTLYWTNSSVIRTGTPIVILLRYGHMTGTGGYVTGYDFIDPSIRPVFDGFVTKIWNEVTSS